MKALQDNPSDNGVCGKEQLAWLEQDLLAASLAGKRLAVFGHHNPVDDRWVFMDDGREDLARITDRNGVRYVFAGHRHSDQLELTETTRVITTRTVQAAPSDLVGYRLVRVVNGRVASWRAAPPKASDSL